MRTSRAVAAMTALWAGMGVGVAAHAAAVGSLSTIAGNGTSGHSPDGTPALSAQLYNTTGIALDSKGNVYFTEGLYFDVRKLDVSTGLISTYAGGGVAAGENIAAVGSYLHVPSGLAFDAQDNLYIADTYNGRIRKVDAASQTIKTVAGGGALSGDGVSALQASMNSPGSVAVDSAGDIFISDYANNNVREVLASDNTIHTIAGTGTKSFGGDGGQATAAYLNYPMGLVVDGAGNVYVADSVNNRVRKISKADGKITTVAGSGVGTMSDFTYVGPGTQAGVMDPWSLAFAANGDLLIAQGSWYIWRLDLSTGQLSGDFGSTFVGSNCTANCLWQMFAIAADPAGDIFITSSASEIYKMTPPSLAAQFPVDAQSGFKVLHPVFHGGLKDPCYIAANFNAAGHATVTVFNAAAKPVRVLYDSAVAAGFLPLTWDGTDDHGTPVASGLYAIRCSSDQGTRVCRAVVLR